MTKPRKIYQFKDFVFVNPDIMWALRDKYGVKGLAEKAEINLRGLHWQFEINTFRRSQDVRDRLETLYKEITA